MRSNIKRHLLILSVITLISFLAFSEANACVCVPTTIAERLNNHNIAFAGMAIKVEKADKGKTRFTFRVSQVWKGGFSKEFSVFTTSSSCETYFEIRKKYIVFAYGDKELTTSICSGNMDFSAQNAKALRKAQKVLKIKNHAN